MRAIFISYRRSDTEGEAGRLSDLLMSRFSDQAVFMDVDSIAPGRDFRKAIDESIQACSVVLVLIGPTWLDSHDDRGARRLDAPNDYVRLEISAALRRDIPVIPILIRNAKMPHEDQLPEEIRDLAYRNSVELTHARWRSDLQVLIEALEPLLGRTATHPDSAAHSIAPAFAIATVPVAPPTRPPTATVPPQSRTAAPPPLQPRPAAPETSRFSGSIHYSPSVIHPYRPPTAPLSHTPVPHTSVPHTPVPHTPSHASHPHATHAPAEPPAHPASHSAPAPHTAGVPAPAVTHADIEKVSRHLAHFIGPIAEIVVKRAAKKALTMGDLLAAVAHEIESPADRTKFLRECHH